MSRALLLDLDGVLRRWDPVLDAEIERRHRLPAGSLAAAAFGPGSALTEAVTGRVTDAEWRADVARRLGGPDAEAAVSQWSASAGEVDTEVLAVVRSARRAGWRVGVLTNATTRLPHDLRRLGLDREVDVVVNSADLGMAKPAPEVFVEACRLLGVEPGSVVFVDDTAANVVAAAGVGLDAHLHRDAVHLRGLLGT